MVTISHLGAYYDVTLSARGNSLSVFYGKLIATKKPQRRKNLLVRTSGTMFMLIYWLDMYVENIVEVSILFFYVIVESSYVRTMYFR